MNKYLLPKASTNPKYFKVHLWPKTIRNDHKNSFSSFYSIWSHTLCYVFNWHVLFLLTNLLTYLLVFLDLFLFVWLESTHFLPIGALITLPYMTKPSQVTLPNFFLQLNQLNILISATLQWTWLLNNLTFSTIEHSWSYPMILSYDSYVLQSLHPYELLTQDT